MTQFRGLVLKEPLSKTKALTIFAAFLKMKIFKRKTKPRPPKLDRNGKLTVLFYFILFFQIGGILVYFLSGSLINIKKVNKKCCHARIFILKKSIVF